MKAVARELIWFLIAIIIAIPMAYLFSYIINLKPEGQKIILEEKVFEMEMFIIGGVLCFVCVYFVRAIIWAMAKYLIKEDL